MRIFRTIWSIGLLVAVGALAAGAQQIEARLGGRVLDSSQAALPGVTVTATARDTGQMRTAVTADDGSYVITNLQPGVYEVTFELVGFEPRTEMVLLGVAQVKTADAQLGVAAFTEVVTVQAQAPVLDIASARIGVNISPEEVENLPVTAGTLPT